MLQRTILTAAVLVLPSTSARAEAALADLLLMMPAILLKGLYDELARPWLLAAFWAGALLCWLVYAKTGRDVVGDWLDRLSSVRRPLIHTTSYGTLGFFAVASLLYVIVGYALWGPPQRNDRPAYQHTATRQPAKPAVGHTLPYPYGKSPGNPKGTWPTTSGNLDNQPYLAHGGGGLFTLRNPGDEGLWVRLCAADAQPCTPLRQVYLLPRSGFTVDRISAGAYRLEYTRTSGQNLSGSLEGIQIGNPAGLGYNLELRDFAPKP